jgi:hypothetical protein
VTLAVVLVAGGVVAAVGAGGAYVRRHPHQLGLG